MTSNARSDGRVIYLYVPISRAREYAPLPRSEAGALKARALRARDRIGWMLFGSHSFDFRAWCVNAYTNRGDIAIRESIAQLLQGNLGDEKFELVELDWGSLDENALARINASADLFVICGGGYVSADAASGKLSHVIDDVAYFGRMTCPVVAFGIGYNSLLEYAPETRIKVLPDATLAKIEGLSGASRLIGVRDANLLQIMGRSAKSKVDLIGDPALFLKPGHGLPPPESGGKLKVGLNFALHGPVSAAIFREHFDAYVEFLRRVQRERSVAFFYFVHCDTERLAISLLRRAGIKMQVIDRPPAELVSGYGQMDVVITQMLHSSILATNAGVPSMNIAYDRKNLSFYELIGLPHLCQPHDDLTQQRLWEIFTAMVEQRDQISRHLEQKKAELRARTDGFLDQVADLLPDARPVSQGAPAAMQTAD